MGVVGAEGDVVGAHEVAHHLDAIGAGGDGAEIKLLQIGARRFVDLLPAGDEVVKALVEARHQIGNGASEVRDDEADIREVAQETRIAHPRHGKGAVEEESDDRTQNVILELSRHSFGHHRMDEDAELATVGLFEEGTEGRVGQRPASNVGEEDDSVQVQFVEGPLELG